MKKLSIFLVSISLVLPTVVLAQSWADPYTGGTSGSGYLPTNSINQSSGANITNTTGAPNTVAGYQPLEPLSNFNNGKYQDFSGYLGTAYKLAITIGGLVAVVMLVVSGIRYMLSESFTDKDMAKKRIVNALWGLIILVGSFLILYTINPNILNFSLLNKDLVNVNQSPSNFTAAGNGGGGISAQQTLTPTQMSTSQGYAVGAALGCQNGVVSFVTCTAWGSYISYDPAKASNSDVQKAIQDYTSSCQGISNLWTGSVRTLDGNLLGVPGQTALVCAGPGH